MRCPDVSPWGEIQQYEILCPGAYSVSTAGHGGVMLHKNLAANALSEEARKCGFASGNYVFFKEDCDAPVALRELMDRQLYTAPVNERFAPGEYEKLINSSLQIWHKEYWQAREQRIAQAGSIPFSAIRPMTRTETLYCYLQDMQIALQTGYIGHLWVNFVNDGNELFHGFYDFHAHAKEAGLEAELDELIGRLRSDDAFGSMLKDHDALEAYCHSHPESRITEATQEFGFRIDTTDHAYMLRLHPEQGDCDLYGYCYEKKQLNKHLQRAEKGIRFIDPHYKDLFRIADGDHVRITFRDGEEMERQCRFIDETHVQVGRNLYHICEFAERMERNGNQVVPLRNSLPKHCYSCLPDTGELVILKRGESGYYKTDFPVPDREIAKEIADQCNSKLGITKPQLEAMKAGSMFGWHTPAADPKSYDKDGMLIKPKKHDRGDAR